MPIEYTQQCVSWYNKSEEVGIIVSMAMEVCYAVLLHICLFPVIITIYKYLNSACDNLY